MNAVVDPGEEKEKEEMTEGRKVGRASKSKPTTTSLLAQGLHPPLE